MTNLAQILTALKADTPYTPPPDWLQGRTAYGGLSAAMALHIAQRHTLELPPLKSALISFIGPVTAGVTFAAETLRRGKSVTQISVDARVDGALALRAAFTFAGSRPSAIQHDDLIFPEVHDPETYAPPPSSMPAPDFLHHFDVRFVSSAIPISQAPHPEMLAWVRLKQADAVRPDLLLLALADCLPPAASASFAAPAPISSMTWAVDLPWPAATDSDWFLLHTRSVVAHGGYSYQQMEAWTQAGQLAMISTQTVAIFA